MLVDVCFHLVLEGLGALGLRCALGMCEHRRHQIAAWIAFSVPMSVMTVMLVG